MSKIHQSHPGFDLESEIVKAGNLPSPVELKPWQDRIDKIVGKTVEGRSRLRIVWGQSFEATLWCLGRRRMKYPFWRYEDEGEIHDIGTPRFYVEELHDMAELKMGEGWEKARYQWEGLERLDVLGPVPDEGFYTSVFLIAHHDEWCCNGAGQVKGNLCLGAYRPPTDTDLSRIRKMLFRRNNASNQENAPSPELITKWNQEASVRRDEQSRARLHDAVQNWVAIHGHRITDSMNHKQNARGRFKFMPQTEFQGNQATIGEASNSSASDARP